MWFPGGRAGVRGLGLAAVAAASLMVTGCNGFFVYPGTGSGSTTTGTGDYVYVANSTNGSNYINAYTIGSGTLTAITGSPFSIGFTPIAMAVSPNDEFLYVAGEASAGVFVYSISSDGAISGQTQFLPAGTEVDAMTISPDGNFLYILGTNTLAIQEELQQYTLNTSTGAYSGQPVVYDPPGLCIPNTQVSPVLPVCGIAVSPSKNYVAVANGSQGTVIFPYSSSGGILASTLTINPASSTSADSSVAFDISGNLYIDRTAGVATYGSFASASASPTNTSTAPITSSLMPHAVTLSTNYGYLYTADAGGSSISAFSVSNGTLTALSGSPQIGPSSVAALGVDRSGSYLLAAGYNATNGLQMFTISSTGIAAVASQGTGSTTSVPSVIALTH